MTSPDPSEKRTIGGEEVGVGVGVGVGLCDCWGELECCRRIEICSGEAGKLRLLKRLMSSADRLWCRWIISREVFSGTVRIGEISVGIRGAWRTTHF